MEVAEHRNVLGTLAWLCTQTRPDLAADVSMAQRAQNVPAVSGLLQTNRAVSDARRHTEAKICIPPLDGNLTLVVSHDAVWANGDEPGLEGEKSEEARLTFASEAPKRLRVRSQVGCVIYITTQRRRHDRLAILDGETSMPQHIRCRDRERRRHSGSRRGDAPIPRSVLGASVGPDDRRPACLPDQVHHGLRVVERLDPQRGCRSCTC